MAEESSVLTMPTEELESFPSLTKEEWMERLIWTLQYHYEELLEADLKAASKFMRWAYDAFDAAYESKWEKLHAKAGEGSGRDTKAQG